ncbi:ZIP family metal transporter [Corallococcus sicarius]|uniref:ZIP family metal transporter n=1 Tax=Corallococcus sicarius TaxID=2316726 RepID=A0A3A8NEY3_9BACT|nr:ZIP family metal transporter [Corallococcus sicarius]RKH42897.1 ZIP family metal transporter [Corallococcus sicarius]
MSPVVAEVFLYSCIVVMSALAGALVVVFNDRSTRLVTFLAFAAGVMFGAAFFHMLPEAYEGGGWWAFALVPLGFLFVLVLERYLVAHACEEPPDCAEHVHGHALGLSAFLGLSAHTLFDGIALGSSVKEGVGAMALLAITAHKVPSSLSLASILQAEGKKRGTVLAYTALYGLMVPVGALLYFGFDAVLRFESLAPKAMAFSAGTFLYIAVSDLLPHVNKHGRDKPGRNLVALAAGLLVMFLLARFLGHTEH